MQLVSRNTEVLAMIWCLVEVRPGSSKFSLVLVGRLVVPNFLK